MNNGKSPNPILITCFLILSLTSTASADSKRDHANWWIEKYGALQGKDHPLVPRIHDVFEKVRKAADKRGNHLPRLVILRGAGGYLAMCVKDGTVFLTRKAMEICYQGKDKPAGDARAAFILGHELAHLANGDFWYEETSENLRSFAPRQTGETLRIRLIPEAESADMKQNKELKADAYGLLYASLAGYDPKHIVNSEDTNFFQEWGMHIAQKIAAHDASHPPAKLRAGILLSNMRNMAEHLALFDIGVRLFQLGRYKDALVFLEAFREKFPCREVLNNIGLIHYQISMNKLAECDPEIAYRFKLPALLDTETRARSYIMRDPHKDGCERRLFKDAIRYLRDACRKDAFYLPARVNYASALIMAGEYSKAMGIITDEALKNWGVNRQPIFLCQENWGYFLKQLRKYFLIELIDIIAYYLVPNHYHLMIYLKTDELGSKIMHPFTISYTGGAAQVVVNHIYFLIYIHIKI